MKSPKFTQQCLCLNYFLQVDFATQGRAYMVSPLLRVVVCDCGWLNVDDDDISGSPVWFCFFSLFLRISWSVSSCAQLSGEKRWQLCSGPPQPTNGPELLHCLHARPACDRGNPHHRLLLQQWQRQWADDLHWPRKRIERGGPLDWQRVCQPAAQLQVPRLGKLLHHLVVPHGWRRAVDQWHGGGAAVPEERLHNQPWRGVHSGQRPGWITGHLQRRRLRGQNDRRQRVGLRANHSRHPGPDVMWEEQHSGGKCVHLGNH